MRRFFCRYALIALASVSACGGDGGAHSTEPPPPPVPETTSVRIIIPTGVQASTATTIAVASQTISLSADGRSNKIQGGLILDDSKYSWTLNGSQAAQGQKATISLLYGINNICVEVTGMSQKASDCIVASFNPRINCKIVAADATSESLPSSPIKVTFSKGADSVTRTVNADGDCSIEGILGSKDSVRIVVDPGSLPYHPMIAYASKANIASGLTLILVPTSFVVTGGVYQRQVVPIDLEKAYTTGTNVQGYVPETSFYLRDALSDGRYFYWVNSALPTALPMPRIMSDSIDPIPPESRDSIASYLGRLNDLTGWTISRPATLSESLTVRARKGMNWLLILRDSIGMAKLPATGSGGGLGTERDISGGIVTFSSIASINLRIATHEMLHVLGFGHGCGWHSVMNNNCPQYAETPEPSLEDIAYARLMYRVRELERKYNTSFSLGESHQGERVLRLGKAEQFLYRPY